MRAEHWMAAAVVLMAVTGWLLWPFGGGGPPVSASGTQAGAMVAAAPVSLFKTAAKAGTALAKPVQSQSGGPALVDLARRRALNKELFASRDVLSFVRAHLAEARAGDGEAQFALGFALTLCRSLQGATMADGRPLHDALGDPAASEQQRRIAQNVADRCDAQDQARDEVGTALDWFRQADRSGIGAAMLMEAESKDFGLEQARIDKVRQAVATGDPAVVYMLVAASERWDRPRDALETADPEAGHVFAAEQLTECALGYDCSGSGEIYQQWCTHRSCPHADTVQREYELSMSPQQFAAVQDYAATLAANIRSGGDNWPEAQKLEQGIVRQQAPELP
jgi:hypothetical protein